MSGSRTAQLSAKEQERLGLPGNWKTYSPFPFSGMNQEDARNALEDPEFYWVENFLLTGKGSYRTLWGEGEAIYTAPAGKTIVYFLWFNIADQTSCAVFLSDGTAVQVDYPSRSTVWISPTPGTFYNGGQLPCACQFGESYLLISNNLTANNYWVWDGSILYAPGTLGPWQVGDLTSAGSGYTSAPTVTFVGGSGSGAAGTASISNGSVVGVQITNPGTGYSPSDSQVQIVFSGGGTDNGAELVAVLGSGNISAVELINGGSGYTSPPAISFSGGGGSGATATATLTPVQVALITVTAGGTGYTSAPTVLISGGGGVGATATATVSGGAVTAVTVTSGGIGYTSLPTISFTGGGGTGATANAALSGGAVASINLASGGSGYTSTPTVVFTGGGGSGASAAAVLSSGSVASVTVVNGGTGFTGTPTLTIVGGGGTGATATANVTSGAISSVDVTAGGSGYTSAPEVIVAAGSNNAASGNIGVMPFGVSGTTIEGFLSRVWIANPFQVGPLSQGGTLNVSAPGSITDFASSDGGLIFTNNDRFLRQKFVALHQSNGYLYTLSDSAVSVISNVQTTGSPSTTTFNFQNTSAQSGAAFWRDSVQDYGQAVLFGNPIGIQGLYGGAIQKISKKINNIFDLGVFPPAVGAVTPSGAVANIHTIPCYLLNMTITDPFTNSPRTVLIGWDEKDFFIASQSSPLTFIGTQEIASLMTAWGTDGTNLFPLFQTPSTGITKRLDTKLFAAEREYLVKEPLAVYVRATDKSSAQSGISMAVTVEGEGQAQQIGQQSFAPTFQQPLPVQPAFLAPNGTLPSWGAVSSSTPGTALALTMTSTSLDFVLSGLTIAYTEIASIYN